VTIRTERSRHGRRSARIDHRLPGVPETAWSYPT